MSWTMPDEPFVDRDAASPVETVILPRTRDLGGFTVRRALPSMRRFRVANKKSTQFSRGTGSLACPDRTDSPRGELGWWTLELVPGRVA